MFAFLNKKANPKEICDKISSPSFKRKMHVLPHFFLVDSNSPCKDLLLPHGPNLAQKPCLYEIIQNKVVYVQSTCTYAL